MIGRKKDGLIKICKFCSSEFYVNKRRYDERIFCSQNCYRMNKRLFTYDDINKRKLCTGCNQWKDFSMFNARNKGSDELDVPLLQKDCKECGKKADRDYKESNREKLREYKRALYWMNPERYRNIKRMMSDEQRILKNKKQREYAIKNKDKVLMWNKLRVHRLRANGHIISRHEIGMLLCIQDARCVYCQKLFNDNKYHIDHKIAISKGGNNDIDNIQLLCPTCNMKKSVTSHHDYIKRLFGLSVDEFDLMRRKEWEIRNYG